MELVRNVKTASVAYNRFNARGAQRHTGVIQFNRFLKNLCTQEESKKQTTLVEGLLFKTIYDLCFESKNSPVHYLAIEGNLLILKTLVSLTINKHLHIVEYLFIAIQSLLRHAIA